MSRATRQPGVIIANSNPALANSDVLIGGTQRLQYQGQTDTNQNYRVVYVPSTRETIVVLQTFNPLGGSNALDANQRIATLGPNNRWIPSEYANTLGGQPLVDAINRNGTTANNFTQSARIAINQDSVDRTGRQLTSQQMSTAQTSANSTSPSITTNSNVLGTSRTGSQQQQQPDNSSPPDGTPTTGAVPPENTRDSSGTGSVVGNRGAVRDAITTVVNIDSLIPAGQAATGGAGAISYPLSFPDNMDYIEFTEKDYGKSTFNKDKLTFDKRKNINTPNKVKLPIQTGISDANTVGWNEETFNPAQIAGAQLAIGGIEGGPEGIIGQIANVAGKLENAKTDIERAIIAYFTEQAVGVQILPKIGGAIINPNTELLFQGPQLRSFNFSFRLTPRSKDESIRVKQILRFFKSTMAAQTTEGGIFLKSPKVFGIKFYHGGTENKEHSGIGKIKDCALQACNVDYTPDGSYMSFKDGGMVSYSLNLQFMELEPIYAKDYNETDHAIGY